MTKRNKKILKRKGGDSMSWFEGLLEWLKHWIGQLIINIYEKIIDMFYIDYLLFLIYNLFGESIGIYKQFTRNRNNDRNHKKSFYMHYYILCCNENYKSKEEI